MGGSRVVGGVITRNAPWPYPPSPNMYCREIGAIRGIKPITGSDGWVYYETCVIPATFLVPTWGFTADDPASQNDPSGQPWTTTVFNLSASEYQPPKGTFYWLGGTQAGKKVLNGIPGLLRPNVEISMTRHLMPWNPLEFAVAGIGTVNAAEFTIADKTFPPGYAFFAGVRSTESPDSFGSKTWEWEYTFLANTDHEWNQIIDDANTYQYLNTAADGSGSGPFKYYDWWTYLP